MPGSQRNPGTRVPQKFERLNVFEGVAGGVKLNDCLYGLLDQTI